MKKLYVVLYESRHHGLVGYVTTLVEANKLLKIEDEVYYIFKLDKKQDNLIMKIRYPMCEFYDCLSKNIYTEEVFDDTDDYVIIKISDDLINLDVEYK